MEADPSSRKQAIAISYIFVAGMLLVLLQWSFTVYNSVESIPYSEFEQLVSQGKVAEVSVGQDSIEGKLKDKLRPRTVEFHRAHIMEKTAAQGLPDLVRLSFLGRLQPSAK
jgi:cell division protease FtsH